MSRQNLDMLNDNLKTRLSDHQYWSSLVSRLGVDSSVYQQPPGSGIPSWEALCVYLDSTQLGLLSVVHSIYSNNNQTILASDVAKQLYQQGTYTHRGAPEADTAFQELMDMISMPSSGKASSSSITRHVDQPEFIAVLISLRLAAILYDSQLIDENLRINLHEYREYQLFSTCPIEHPAAVLFKRASELLLNRHIMARTSATSHLTGEVGLHFRLLHVHEASKKAILLLGATYGLDPRFVLHLLSLWREEAKVDQVITYDENYGGAATDSSLNIHNSASPFSGSTPNLPDSLGAPSVSRPMSFFIVVPILRLSEHSRETLRKYQAWRECMMPEPSARGGDSNTMFKETLKSSPRVDIIVERCNLAVFVSGMATGGTIVAFSSRWVELMKLKTDERKSGTWNWKTNNTSAGNTFERGLKNDEGIGSNRKEKWRSSSDRVSDTCQLSVFHKVLAQIKTLHSSLTTCDAHLFLLKVLGDITEDYLLIAKAYEAYLQIASERTDKDKLNAEEVRRITNCIQQLTELQRVTRPVICMADTLSSRTRWNGDALLCLSDTKSKVANFLAYLSTFEERAKSMLEEYKKSNAAAAKSTLYTLALVNIAFVLGQFLKWLCGINLHSYVVPSMSPLTWEHLYLYFWFLLIWYPSVMFILYRRRRFVNTN